MIDLQEEARDAALDGKIAAQSGESTAANPFPEQSFLHGAWLTGWRAQMISEGEHAPDDTELSQRHALHDRRLHRPSYESLSHMAGGRG